MLRFYSAIEKMFKTRTAIMKEIEETMYEFCEQKINLGALCSADLAEINLCTRLLSESIGNGSADHVTRQRLGGLVQHTNINDIGDVKRLFRSHGLENSYKKVCEALAKDDISLGDLRQHAIAQMHGLDQDLRDKLYGLTSEAHINSKDLAERLVAKGDILGQLFLTQESVYDFSFLDQALTAYEEAMECLNLQMEHDFASSAWSPQLADLQNKIGVLKQQRGKRADGSYQASKLAEASSIFESNLRHIDEALEKLSTELPDTDRERLLSSPPKTTMHRHSSDRKFQETSYPHQDTLQDYSLSVNSLNASSISVAFNPDEYFEMDPGQAEFDSMMLAKLDTLEHINTQAWKCEKRAPGALWPEFLVQALVCASISVDP